MYYYYFGNGKPKLEARDLQGIWSRVKQYNTRMRNIKKKTPNYSKNLHKTKRNDNKKILNRKEEYKI